MALIPSLPEGATPIEPEEMLELIPSQVFDSAELNFFEGENISVAKAWYAKHAIPSRLDTDLLMEIHRRMFGDTWRWAGMVRTTLKNLGADVPRIRPDLHELCENVNTQLEFTAISLDEIAARLSHKLAQIHPFVNGNGRHSRFVADLLLVRHGQKPFTWGGADLSSDGEIRRRYIAAMRSADGHDYRPLMQFVRS